MEVSGFGGGESFYLKIFYRGGTEILSVLAS